MAKKIFSGFIMKKGVFMSEISFGSSYKIPVSQWGINNTKKIQLKSLIGSYSGKICGKGQDSFALVSIQDKKDMGFIRKLRKIGYFQFEMFENNKIPQNLKNLLGN